jgi:N-hydroxyarylamine O-acetyltransferase
MAMLDLDAYLRRIGYDGPRDPNADTLRSLVETHRRNVPFENLDIPRGRPIALDEIAIYDKIVVRGRGGFCHELNRLFRWALTQLGYPTVLLGTGVLYPAAGEVFPPLSHQMLLVSLAERWLVDVAFGARGARVPLRLDSGASQSDGVNLFRIDRTSDGYTLRTLLAAEWRPLYEFNLEPRQPSDFDERCRQQEAEAYWNAHWICTRTDPGGHISLDDRRLITVRNGQREERLLDGDEELRTVLRETFGLDLADAS